VPAFDLDAALVRLATRNPGRTEADIQAGVRDVLLYGGFELAGGDVYLEAPTPDRHRIDVLVGGLILECKRDLRPPTAVATAAKQLGGYLDTNASTRHMSGVLTDGVRWLLYRRTEPGLRLVDELTLNPGSLDVPAFRWWLGALLSTESGIRPTTQAIEQRLGAGSSAFRVIRSTLADIWRLGAPSVRLM
jgi:hypothetical protein